MRSKKLMWKKKIVKMILTTLKTFAHSKYFYSQLGFNGIRDTSNLVFKL